MITTTNRCDTNKALTGQELVNTQETHSISCTPINGKGLKSINQGRSVTMTTTEQRGQNSSWKMFGPVSFMWPWNVTIWFGADWLTAFGLPLQWEGMCQRSHCFRPIPGVERMQPFSEVWDETAMPQTPTLSPSTPSPRHQLQCKPPSTVLSRRGT